MKKRMLTVVATHLVPGEDPELLVGGGERDVAAAVDVAAVVGQPDVVAKI